MTATHPTDRASPVSPGEPGCAPPARAFHAPLFVLGALTAAMLWSYWPVATELARDWKSNEDYSAGVFVPIVAAVLIWFRRAELSRIVARPCLWAIALVLAAELVRYWGLRELRQSVERYAMVLEFIGLAWLVMGTRWTRANFWVLAFLFLMVPLPGTVHSAIADPMQSQATGAANFVLELLGIVVTREGNTLTLNHRIRVGIVEACSGLRMMTTFLVVACFLALSIRRPIWQRVGLVVSSVPVAIVCNVVRIVATAVLLLATDGSRTVETLFHDFAGYAMMPVAVLLLAAELWFFRRLVIEDRANPATT